MNENNLQSNVVAFPSKEVERKLAQTFDLEIGLDDKGEVLCADISGGPGALTTLSRSLYDVAWLVADGARDDTGDGSLDTLVFAVVIQRDGRVRVNGRPEDFSRPEEVLWLKQRLAEALLLAPLSPSVVQSAYGTISNEP